MKKETENYWELRQSAIHNVGVFAKRDIPKGVPIVQYSGQIISKEEASLRLDSWLPHSLQNDLGIIYNFTLEDGRILDGNVDYNNARFINHSCDENCESIYVRNTESMWIYSKRDIKMGEELTYDYGFSTLESYREFPCHCGSANCCGYIIDSELRPQLREILKQETEKKVSVGEPMAASC